MPEVSTPAYTQRILHAGIVRKERGMSEGRVQGHFNCASAWERRGKVKEMHVGVADNGWRLWYIEGTEFHEEMFVVRRELIDRFAELAERLSQS